MSFPSQNNISFTLVGKNIASSSKIANGTLISGYADLADGQIAILDKDNKAVDAAAGNLANREIRLVQRSGVELKYTPYFIPSNATGKSIAYTAPTEQVTTITTISGTEGSVLGVWLNMRQAFTATPYLKDFNYKVKAGDSVITIADGLIDAANAAFGREPAKLVKFERVTNGTATALAANATVVNGSKSVACTGHGLTAGTYVGLAGATYKIASVTTNAFVLDQPFVGTSATITAGTTYASQGCSLASITTANLVITSLAQTFQINKFEYPRVTFQTVLKNFPVTTTVVETAIPVEGVGTYEQVAVQEEFSNYNQGKILRETYLTSTAIPLDAVSGTAYRLLTINAKKFTPSLASEVPSYFTVTIAFYNANTNQSLPISTTLSGTGGISGVTAFS